MKQQLVKRQDRFDLYNESDGSKIASTLPNPMGKLSLKNCQAIENGYDLDEIIKLADEDFECELGDGPTNNESINSMLKKSNANGAEWGFQKAIEILGGKKFSEEDMRRALSAGLSIGYGRQFEIENKQIEIDKHIQSLQQTEFDVEIVMGCCGKVYSQHCDGTCEHVKPLLDADGCLILKRK
jgi:hypothetical protein